MWAIIFEVHSALFICDSICFEESRILSEKYIYIHVCVFIRIDKKRMMQFIAWINDFSLLKHSLAFYLFLFISLSLTRCPIYVSKIQIWRE